MPAKIHQAIARQWQLLKLLPSKGAGLSARELAERLAQGGFEVTKRTVERDLNELVALFPLYCNDKNPPYGWRWADDAHSDLPSLELSDALSLKLLEEFLVPLLPGAVLESLASRFQLARTKLEKLHDQTLSRWSDKVRVVPPALHLLPPRIEPDILETIHDTLLNDRQVEVSYYPSGREKPQALALHPLGLVQRGPVTYLVATAFDYEDARLYAMHRIKAAKRLGKECRRPENFSLDSYLASGALDFGDGKRIRFEAMVAESLATLLRETPLSEDMEIQEGENGFLLTCTVIDSWQLHWWILSLGDEIEVLAPKELRKKIAQRLRDAAGVYPAR